MNKYVKVKNKIKYKISLNYIQDKKNMEENNTFINLTNDNGLIELFYIKIGSTWAIDTINLFIMCPFALFTSVLNLMSFQAFRKIKVQKSGIRNYFKIYSIAAFSFCAISLSGFLTRSPRLINVIFSYWCGLFRCKINIYQSTFYFFTNLLDCIIIMERLINFHTSFTEKFKFLNHSNVVCLATFLTTSTLSIANFFFYNIRDNSEFVEAIKSYEILQSFTYCRRVKSNFNAELLILLLLIIRDFLPLILEIILSVLLIKYFKVYLDERKRILYSNKKKKSNHLLSMHIVYRIANNSHSVDIKFKEKISNLENYNTKLTKMILWMSFCSILSHIGASYYYIIFMIYDNSLLAHSSLIIANCFILVKYATNFFFIYYFNGNFKKYINKFFL